MCTHSPVCPLVHPTCMYLTYTPSTCTSHMHITYARIPPICSTCTHPYPTNTHLCPPVYPNVHTPHLHTSLHTPHLHSPPVHACTYPSIHTPHIPLPAHTPHMHTPTCTQPTYNPHLHPPMYSHLHITHLHACTLPPMYSLPIHIPYLHTPPMHPHTAAHSLITCTLTHWLWHPHPLHTTHCPTDGVDFCLSLVPNAEFLPERPAWDRGRVLASSGSGEGPGTQRLATASLGQAQSHSQLRSEPGGCWTEAKGLEDGPGSELSWTQPYVPPSSATSCLSFHICKSMTNKGLWPGCTDVVLHTCCPWVRPP
jgi:hypothetical protein